MSDLPALLIGVPVLGRPANAAPLVENIRETTPDAVVIFLVSPGDTSELLAVDALLDERTRAEVMSFRPAAGDFAKKHNHAYARAAEEEFDWYFTGADDLRFHPGWYEAALAAHRGSNACVIGTKDLGNPRTANGWHSTHFLVHRDYLECGTIDEPGKLLHEGYSHEFCNPPEAPIWMADCSFKPLGEIEVGDRVIGWEISATARPTTGHPRRSLAYSEVLGVRRRHSALVLVTMESGRQFRCTPDHRWLNALWTPSLERNPRAYTQWVAPAVGRTLLHVMDDPGHLPPGLERVAGWVAGIYDGEGSGVVVAGQTQENQVVIQELDRALTELGFSYSHTINGKMSAFTLTGGRQEYLKFLLQINPMRRQALASYVVGYKKRDESRKSRAAIGARRFGHRDKVVAVVPCGEGEVISMTTSTGNYVAWGYASRNCDDEAIQTARWRRTYSTSQAVVEHLHPDWGKAERDATYEKAQANRAADAALFSSRRHMFGRGVAR